jgi:hypothetical protein
MRICCMLFYFLFRQESERSCIWVLGVSTLPLSTILIFYFWIVSTVWYFLLLMNLGSKVMNFYIITLLCLRVTNQIYEKSVHKQYVENKIRTVYHLYLHRASIYTHENLLHGIFYFKQYLQFGAVMHIPFFGRMVYFIIHEQPTVVHWASIYCS